MGTMSILPLLLSLLAVNTVSCTEGVSRLELLKMVQNLTGRVEQLEQGRNLTDEVGKLGEAMTGAVEKLGNKTEKLGEAMTGTVEKLGEKLTQGLGEAMTGAVEKLGDKTEKLGEAMTGAVEKLGEKLTQGLGEAMTGAMEKLGDKTDKLGEAMTGAVEKLGDKTEKLGEAMTGAVEKLGDKTEKVGETMTGAMEKLGDKTETLGESLTNAIQRLDNIHLLTTARNQTLRVDLEDFENNTAYAEYRFFAIDGPDSFYRLHVDGLYWHGSLTYHNNHPFSTHDSDHDLLSVNCAVDWRGAWWYKWCAYSNLNGPYLTSAQRTGKSISWYHWKNAFIALKHVEMKIRPAM
nr:hypothetical protein BaRGS_013611 [Batillaria attramentaria]